MYLAPWEDLREYPEGLNCKGVFGEQARQQMQQHQPLGVKKGSVLTAPPTPSSDGVPRQPHQPRLEAHLPPGS